MRQNSTLALLGRPSKNQEKAGRKNSHLDSISPREEIKLGRGEVAQPFYTGIRCNKSSTLTLKATTTPTMRQRFHIRILPGREIVAININMTKGDEARVAHTMIAQSGRVYNRHDRLAKELLTCFCCAVPTFIDY